MDLATANSVSNDVSVLLGKGDGNFGGYARFAVGRGPSALIASDLDGDGWLDLAKANGSGDVSALLASPHLYSGQGGSRYNSCDPNGPRECRDDEGRVLSHSSRISPPASVPGTLSVACSGPEGAMVDFNIAVQDDCSARPLVTCDFPPGTLFPPGTTLVTCTAQDASGNRSQCGFEVVVACPMQLPGDCNQDRKVDISDAICVLRHLFAGPLALPCGDGTRADPANLRLLDWNGDGSLNISDVVGSLSWLFLEEKPHLLGRSAGPLACCPQLCL